MTRVKSRVRPRESFAWALCFAHFALSACTDPVERSAPLNAVIDADTVVRASTVAVEIVLQGERSPIHGGSKIWEMIMPPVTFRPESDDKWPWRTTLTAEQSSQYERFDLLAIARDSRRAVVGRVQVIRDLAAARRTGLRARFDTACFRREECDDGFTCAGGTCVDATQVSSAPAADGGMEPATLDGSTEIPDQLEDGIATESGSCKTGQVACTEHGSRTPLICEGGSWKAQPECSEAERCSTAEGVSRGTCQAIVDQCANRKANVPFCDGEMMRICPDLVSSVVRPCSTNERCVSTAQDSAECQCKAGFVPEGGRCTQPSKCGTNNGGCDTVTQCTTQGDKRVCGTCPTEYTGTGDQGCSPLLLGLVLSSGTLEPAFASNVQQYRMHVPLVGQRVTFTPSVPANTMVTVNGEPLDARGTWTSPVLTFDATPVKLEITSTFGVTSQYAFTLQRAAEQVGYLQPVNPASLNQFGSAVDISGDTLVVTAWFDDSAATGIDGDPQNTGAEDSGAAHVYVRDGAEWRRQAYIKPSDTTTYDFFGTSVDLRGDLLVVGAIHEGLFGGTGEASRPGAAYVFERTAGVWKQTQLLAPSMPNGLDYFGMAVVLNGDTLAVGAPADSTGGSRSGAVYVYQRSGSTFTEVQKLKALKPIANAAFGSNVSIDGDRMVVGAPASVLGSSPGSAEVFIRDGGMWKSSQLLQQEKLAGGASFGYVTALRGNRLAISAPRPSDYPGSPTPTDPGEVYVYEFSGDAGNWKQTAVLTAPYPRATNWFGLSMLLTDSGIFVASPGDASGGRGVHADPARGSATFSGAVHLFAPTPAGWVESAFIKGDNTTTDDWFGSSIAADGDLLAVSARFEDSGGTSLRFGAAYVFR
jgi:hypothetical protein